MKLSLDGNPRSRERLIGGAGASPVLAAPLSDVIAGLSPVHYWKFDDPSPSSIAQHGSYAGPNTLSLRSSSPLTVAGPDGGMYPTLMDTASYYVYPSSDETVVASGGALTFAMAWRPELRTLTWNLFSRWTGDSASRPYAVFGGSNTKWYWGRQLVAPDTWTSCDLLSVSDGANIAPGKRGAWNFGIFTMDHSNLVTPMQAFINSTVSPPCAPLSGTPVLRSDDLTGQDLEIGGFSHWAGYSAQSAIAHFSMWDRLLTPTEINSLMASATDHGWTTQVPSGNTVTWVSDTTQALVAGPSTVVQTMPAGIVAGDLILAYVMHRNSAGVTLSDAGFKRVSTKGAISWLHVAEVWTKVADGSESGQQLTVTDPNGTSSRLGLAFGVVRGSTQTPTVVMAEHGNGTYGATTEDHDYAAGMLYTAYETCYLGNNVQVYSTTLPNQTTTSSLDVNRMCIGWEAHSTSGTRTGSNMFTRSPDSSREAALIALLLA